jgi:hypothetical protein
MPTAEIGNDRVVTMWNGIFRRVNALRARGPVPGARMRLRLLARLLGDEAGMQVVIMALAMPAVLGLAALGTDGARFGYNHLILQAAADATAASVAKLSEQFGVTSSNLSTEAVAIAATYGIAATYTTSCPQNTACVTVNNPPTSGAYAGVAGYFEAVITQPQTVTLASYFGSSPFSMTGRAVAAVNPTGGGDCMMSKGNIDLTASNININISGCGMYSGGNINLNASNEHVAVTSGSVGAGGSVNLGGSNDTVSPTPTSGISLTDPFASSASSWPATCGSCTQRSVPTDGTYTLQPGAYPSGMMLDGTSCTTTTGKNGKTTTKCNTNNNVTYTMQPGIYYLGGNLSVPSNGITLSGTGGVTIVLTGNNVVNVSGNGAAFNLTAPSSGWNQGLAIWEPTSTGTNNFSGGDNGGNATAMTVTGLIYMPDATMSYSGNFGTQASPDCTEIIANAINLGGSNLHFASGKNCSNVPGAPSKTINASIVLVE